MNTVRIICLPIRMCSRDKNHGVLLFHKPSDNEGMGGIFRFNRNQS